MNYFTTIVLLFLLIVVGLFYVGMDRWGTAPDDDFDRQAGTTQQGTPLFNSSRFPHESIESITIERGEKVYELTYDGSNWEQSKPVRFRLEEWSSKRIGRSAAELAYVESFNTASGKTPTLEELGLSPPKAVVTFRFNDDLGIPDRTIGIGARLGVGGRGYVTIDNDKRVYVVNDDLHEQVEDDNMTDLRRKNIDAPSEGQVDRVTLQRGGETVAMAKTEGNWSLDLPHSGRVDRKHVETLLTDIKAFHIDKFIKDQPEDPSVYGLDEPARIVTIRKPPAPDVQTATTKPAQATTQGTAEDQQTKEEKTPTEPTMYTLRVGSAVDLKNESYFAISAQGAHGGNVVFSLSKSSVEKLDKTANDFRDARITPVESNNVRQLLIQRPQYGSVGLLRATDQWQFEQTNDPGFEADDGQATTLVETITSAKADAYIANAAHGSEPTATITLGALARPEPDVLKIYSTDDQEQLMVMRNNETTGYLVKKEDLAAVFAPALALRDRIVLHLPQTEVNRISIKRPDGTSFVFERDMPPPPQAESPQQSEADQAAPIDPDSPAPAPAQTQPVSGAQTPVALTGPQPGPWQMIGFNAFESTAFDDLLQALTPLQAVKWLSDNADNANATHVVEIQSGAKAVTLAIHTTSRVARASGVDAPFEVSEALAEAVDAELRHRTVLLFSTTDIQRVVVSRNDGSLAITKDQDDQYVSDGDEKIDQSAAGGLFDTVAGLRVERYVTHSPASSALVTIEVELAGAVHNLKVARADSQDPTVTIGQQSYTISEQVFEKLTAPLIEDEGQ